MIITYMAMPTKKRRAVDPTRCGSCESGTATQTHQKQGDDDECCIMMPVCKKRHSSGVHDTRASSITTTSTMQSSQGTSTLTPPCSLVRAPHQRSQPSGPPHPCLPNYGRYMQFVMALAKQRRTDGVCCIPCDYVHRLAAACALPAFKIMQFRYNSINWASHYYTVHRFSLSTTSVFIDLFDRYMSNLTVMDHGCDIAHSIFDNSSNMIILPIVITRIAMNINEDKTYRLTSVDVNRYLSLSDSQQLTTMDFVNQERAVLMTLNFKLYDFSSLLTIREALIAKLPIVCGYRSPHEEPLFSSYCRFVIDVTQLCYAVCSSYAPLDVATVCIYIAYVWWPKNYVRIVQHASQQHQQQGQQQPTPSSPGAQQHDHDVVPLRIKKDAASLRHLCALVDCSIPRLNDIARDVLDRVWSVEQPTYASPHGSTGNVSAGASTNEMHSDTRETLSCIISYVAQKYNDDGAGCVNMIGYPTKSEFEMYKSTLE
jgi:hypothetical protein